MTGRSTSAQYLQAPIACRQKFLLIQLGAESGGI